MGSPRLQLLMRNGKEASALEEKVPDSFYLESDGTSKERVSVFGIVRRLREQRWNLVKTTDQYKYVYHFLREWMKANYLPL